MLRTFLSDLCLSPQGCKSFVNDNPVTKAFKSGAAKTPELLARHCDAVLKSNASPEELEGQLGGVMVVFKVRAVPVLPCHLTPSVRHDIITVCGSEINFKKSSSDECWI